MIDSPVGFKIMAGTTHGFTTTAELCMWLA